MIRHRLDNSFTSDIVEHANSVNFLEISTSLGWKQRELQILLQDKIAILSGDPVTTISSFRRVSSFHV
jgi:hypothetical protein